MVKIGSNFLPLEKNCSTKWGEKEETLRLEDGQMISIVHVNNPTEHNVFEVPNQHHFYIPTDSV